MGKIIDLQARPPRAEWLKWLLEVNTRQAAPVAANESLASVIDRLGMLVKRCEIEGLPGLQATIRPAMMARRFRARADLDPETQMTLVRKAVATVLEECGLKRHSPIGIDYYAFARENPGFVIDGNELLMNASATIQMNTPGRTPVAAQGFAR